MASPSAWQRVFNHTGVILEGDDLHMIMYKEEGKDSNILANFNFFFYGKSYLLYSIFLPRYSNMPRCQAGNTLEGEAGGVLCAHRCNGSVNLTCQVSLVLAAKLSMGTLSDMCVSLQSQVCSHDTRVPPCPPF